jgi:hypothetical protein
MLADLGLGRSGRASVIETREPSQLASLLAPDLQTAIGAQRWVLSQHVYQLDTINLTPTNVYDQMKPSSSRKRMPMHGQGGELALMAAARSPRQQLHIFR